MITGGMEGRRGVRRQARACVVHSAADWCRAQRMGTQPVLQLPNEQACCNHARARRVSCNAAPIVMAFKRRVCACVFGNAYVLPALAQAFQHLKARALRCTRRYKRAVVSAAPHAIVSQMICKDPPTQRSRVRTASTQPCSACLPAQPTAQPESALLWLQVGWDGRARSLQCCCHVQA